MCLHKSHVEQLRKIYPYPKNSKCHCCGRKEKLHLDHDYKNKKFRGYLCNSCNTGLGKLGDNKVGLKRALRYLERVDLIKQIPIKRINASVHNNQK
jgi:cell division protein FtsI/penicillin-binding protein 2